MIYQVNMGPGRPMVAVSILIVIVEVEEVPLI